MTTAPILLVTGMSGAGKSTVLRTLEDLGWEVVDNLPLRLLEGLLAIGTRDTGRPLALGLGPQTRGFDARQIVQAITDRPAMGLSILFVDCDTPELERRYNETRRRHPLAQDRPARDGIARERTLLGPLHGFANRLVDTTDLSASDLAHWVRDTFTPDGGGEPVLSVLSFGFSRGVPRDADIVLDMRFLRNPHWDPDLKPGTGRDPDVAAYVMADPAYDAAMASIETMLLTLLPRYHAEGKSYVTVAFGCTGGRHRSVHVAERMGAWLREHGFSPTIHHRDLGTAPQDSLDGAVQAP
ncbi:nucleotide-binding protein [Sphingomonas sp. Leaf407]|uniref:RNase adapter RapZ n=1 Tax=unclassified Sphingomonas TaxID=196159 RepID=UPI0006FADEE9|nr:MULTISPECIES: RNase adapter RapZ [unclassified Sphingomonas]KQN37511.1 nucleotide-binding protein [Sphingomonas sp. Leaf42]KQT27879.1 nucleotide-binding protein [Sphingomonas sp. Leaf407]